MKSIILVGLGGFIGAVGRYKIGGWILHHTESWKFPIGTFAVNVLGCFLMGLLAGWVEKHHVFSNDLRVFLMPGILGGFTTFSAFAYESTFLMRRGEFPVALGYAALSVLCGLAAVWIGLKIMGTGAHGS